jgi:hypothetical protein
MNEPVEQLQASEEPTPRMVQAGVDELVSFDITISVDGELEATVKSIFRAMLLARE